MLNVYNLVYVYQNCTQICVNLSQTKVSAMSKSNVPVSLRYTVKYWSIVYLVSPSVPRAGCGFLIAGVSHHSWSSFLDCPLEKTPGITGKLLNIWIYLDRKYTTKFLKNMNVILIDIDSLQKNFPNKWSWKLQVHIW